MVYLVVLLILWILWSVGIVMVTNKVFKRLKYLTDFDPNKMASVLCGSRYDQAYLCKWKIYLGGIFLLPIRLLIILVFVVVGTTYSIVFVLIFNVNDKNYYRPMSKIYFAGHYYIIGRMSRVVHALMGFNFTPTVRLNLNDFWAGYKPVQDVSRTPLIISNHVSYLDMWLLLHIEENPGFLAKSSIRNLPIVGHFAKIHHTIFFNRDDPTERERITQMINERCRLVEQGGMMAMVIFPEGTTTNGRAIMKFKKGAFAPMKPFYVYSMFYGGNSSLTPCFNLIHPLYSFFILMCQLDNKLTYYKFEQPIDPLYICKKFNVDPTDENAWEVVAEETKKLMCFAFKMDNDITSFQNKKVFDKEMQGLTEEEFRERGK